MVYTTWAQGFKEANVRCTLAFYVVANTSAERYNRVPETRNIPAAFHSEPRATHIPLLRLRRNTMVYPPLLGSHAIHYLD